MSQTTNSVTDKGESLAPPLALSKPARAAWPAWLTRLVGWWHRPAPTGLVRRVDVGRAARPFFAIKWANVAIVGVAVHLVVAAIAVIVSGKADLVSAVVAAVLAAVLAFPAYIAWKNLDVVHTIVRPHSTASLLVFSAVCAFLFLVLAPSSLGAAGKNEISNAKVVGHFAGAIAQAMFVAVGLAAVAAVAWGRRARITDLNLRVKELIQNLDHRAAELPVAPPAPARNPVMGWAMVTLGLLWLVSFQLIPDEILYSDRFIRGAESVRNVGFVPLLLARAYFQPEAKRLLSTDARRPVLYLRSFRDDPNILSLRGLTSLLDFSLETRLGTHFSRWGPFVAVSDPARHLPQMGAARAELGNDEWQPTVLNWMSQAICILLTVGTSDWVKWELSTVIRNGYGDKLIVMLPEPRGSFGWSIRKDARSRMNSVCQAFQGSSWGDALAEPAKRPQDIRALVFDPDGRVVLIASRSRNRNAYHLAALVAHYLLLTRQARLSNASARGPADSPAMSGFAMGEPPSLQQAT